MFQLAQAAITKYCRLGGLNNRPLFSYYFRGQKSEIRVITWSGPGEGPFFWFVDSHLLAVCLHGLSSVHLHGKESSLSSSNGTKPIMWTPPMWQYLNIFTFQRLLLQIHQGLRFQSMNLNGGGKHSLYNNVPLRQIVSLHYV